MKIIIVFCFTFLSLVTFSQGQATPLNPGALPDSVDKSEIILIYLASEEKKDWLMKKLKKKNKELEFHILIASDSISMNNEQSDGYRYTIKAIKSRVIREERIRYDQEKPINKKIAAKHEYALTFSDKEKGQSNTWKNERSRISDNFGPSALILVYALQIETNSILF